ncbi:unnamed protein product [Moneuplotes crassus]|uniref:Uncharacterized protein n=1 Tax=Euplotes crassus TaxID=5936 RepID=A0AAD2D633_EUPCR|nr:unnamed protein product [Moneuplotes crassus]
MGIAKEISMKFTLNKGIKLYGTDRDRFWSRFIFLLTLLILNIIFGIITYVMIKDCKTDSRFMNHFIYPQASMQIAYCFMLLASLLFPMTEMSHYFNLFHLLVTGLSMVFVLADGQTPATGILHIFEFILILILELAFLSIIYIVKGQENIKKYIEKVQKEKDIYKGSNIGEPPKVILHQEERKEMYNSQNCTHQDIVPATFEVVAQKSSR